MEWEPEARPRREHSSLPCSSAGGEKGARIHLILSQSVRLTEQTQCPRGGRIIIYAIISCHYYFNESPCQWLDCFYDMFFSLFWGNLLCWNSVACAISFQCVPCVSPAWPTLRDTWLDTEQVPDRNGHSTYADGAACVRKHVLPFWLYPGWVYQSGIRCQSQVIKPNNRLKLTVHCVFHFGKENIAWGFSCVNSRSSTCIE